MNELQINGFSFKIEADGKKYKLFRETTYQGGNEWTQVLGSSTLGTVQQKIVKLAKSNSFDVNKKIKELNL